MLRKFLFAVCCGLGLAAAPVVAQTSLQKVGSETDWSYFKDENPTECWAVTAPRKTVNSRNGKPAPNVRRSEILLIVFDRPEAEVKGQIAFTGGYPFAAGRPIKMEVDGQTYDLATKGEWAWPPTPEDDAKIIAAMRRGAEAVITGQSGRGTVTRDEFSLLGFTAALSKARELCAS